MCEYNYLSIILTPAHMAGKETMVIIDSVRLHQDKQSAVRRIERYERFRTQYLKERLREPQSNINHKGIVYSIRSNGDAHLECVIPLFGDSE